MLDHLKLYTCVSDVMKICMKIFGGHKFIFGKYGSSYTEVFGIYSPMGVVSFCNQLLPLFVMDQFKLCTNVTAILMICMKNCLSHTHAFADLQEFEL